MTIHRLDLDVAIYRDRVQVTHRATQTFVDQRATYGFSSDASIVADPRYLEHTIVRAIGKVLSANGFEIREPIASVVRCETPLTDAEKAIVERALIGAGMHNVRFEIG